MALDVNLQLLDGGDIVATGTSNPVDVEGGFFAIIRAWLGTCAGTTTTLIATIQASIDGGSNYYNIGVLPTLDEADDDVVVARPVFIPKPTLSSTVKKTKVRISYVVTGTNPVFPVTAFIEPMVSLAARESDDVQAEGVAKLL